MIVYPPIFYGAELKLTFKGKLTWKVADTLQYHKALHKKRQQTKALETRHKTRHSTRYGKKIHTMK